MLYKTLMVNGFMSIPATITEMKPDFYKSQVGKYFVLRTYSHTDHRQLWRVLTRPVSCVMSADVSLQIASEDCPKGQEAFMVKIVNENDAEIDLSQARNKGWHEGYQECLRRIKSGELKV